MQWYLQVLKKYAEFNGRARRKEYWMFCLFNGIVMILLAILGAMGGESAAAALFFSLLILYVLAVLIPGLAVTVRRLHDTNRSGWWFLITFVPLVGGIILLVFTVQDSHPQENQYGTNPKLAAA